MIVFYKTKKKWDFWLKELFCAKTNVFPKSGKKFYLFLNAGKLGAN